MQLQATETPVSGVCVAHGYGVKISVHRGHLSVHDGIGRSRQTRRYHRATSKLRRLVLIGHTGYITLDALRWLHDTGAALVHIDADGKLLITSTVSGPEHAALRRLQALASSTPAGVEVARDLLHAKVSGQASLLADLPERKRAHEIMASALTTIGAATDLPTLLSAEAEAAGAYWGAWSEMTVPFGPRDFDVVPEHWRTFGTRHSVLSNGPRVACNPPNAILNYLYALLEAETTIACHTVGLDPTLGIFHTDQRYRSSLSLDSMEAVRPVVDAYLLAMLTQRTLAREDFAETRQGACRLRPDLTSRLAGTINSWRHHVAPVVEGIAQMLATASPSLIPIAAPLTRAQHRASWSDRTPGRERGRGAVATPHLDNACRDCGTHLPDRRKRYCDDCQAIRWVEHAETGRDNAAAVLARLRTEQRDPAHGGRAAEMRGRKNAEHQRALGEWQGECPDPAFFTTQVLPNLRDLPIQMLVDATGLSQHYCSLIRLGKKVPHPRHWTSLAGIPLSDPNGPAPMSVS